MNRGPGIVWFRRDLRLRDNPAWAQATTNHDEIVALFVLEADLLSGIGPQRQGQLIAGLAALDESLAELGGRLTVRTGPAATAVPRLVSETGAGGLYFNVDYSHFARRRDAAVTATATAAVSGQSDFTLGSFHGNVVQPPGSELTRSGSLSQVFSPFYKRWNITPLADWPDAQPDNITVLGLDGEPIPPAVADPFSPGGEDGAWDRLNRWLEQVDGYPETRNIPAIGGTSELSADLRFGTLAARSVLEVVGSTSSGREAFLRQLAWRDWWAHTLEQNPDLPYKAVRPEYDGVAWRNNAQEFEAWQQGRTGYPLVDAGMRQLTRTGWMHNRVRMVCASFLVKDLLIDWRWGERHFRRLLVDGEPSQNAGNWQWVAGTGPDAAPYFRIFNPTSQSQKFDPTGAYIRTWVPELRDLDDAAIHEPSALGPLELAAAGVTLGDTYPYPLVDHREARERTLAAYQAVKS